MSILLAAVEAGSLSAAARHLRTPLTTVSRKVAELESRLGTRLLNRTSRRLVLTDAGQSYVAACRRILEEVEEAERAASGEYGVPKGELVITAPIVFGRLHVLPIAIEFLKAFSNIDLRLVLSDRVFNLFEEGVDLAVRIGELPDSSLVATRVGHVRVVACGSPAYFEARGTPKNPDELGIHNCITFDGLTSAGVWSFTTGKSRASAEIRSRLIVNTAEAAIDSAIAGLGVTRVLSYQIASAIRVGALVATLREFEPAPRPVSIVYAGRRHLPLKSRAFLDFAVPRLRDGLSEDAAGQSAVHS